MKIGERRIGSGHPCFLIAEAGVNHNGDLRLAELLIDAAAEAGADAVKFQTFKAERLLAAHAPKAEYQLAVTNPMESQLDMLRRLELSPEAHARLRDYASRKGLVFLSSPFDDESADFLHGLGVPLFKIASGELTNLPFLEHVARKGKPMIVSTGMAFLKEVEEAVRVLGKAGCKSLVLLHCTSQYPADSGDCNLKAMVTLREVFNLPVGYSDHTAGVTMAGAAVALGAVVLEKHITLDKNMLGPDHRASLEPDELKRLVEVVRDVERGLGDGVKRPVDAEMNARSVARRSLVAVLDLPAGTILEKHHLAAKRPGTGIAPAEVERLLGRRLVRSLSVDELIRWTDLV
nr:N-acetylneuraminate synthase [Nitrospirota bacterium]